MRMKVKVHETRTSQNELNKKVKGRKTHHRNVKLNFYDHQPSSPRVGAVDTTLTAGDTGRVPTSLGFGVLSLLPFEMPFAR